MAAYQNIFLNQGETYTNQITLDDSNSVGYNLYSFSVASQAKKSYYSANVILNFNATIYDAANGIIQLSANSATTANLPSGKLVYDVTLTDANQNVTRVLEGVIYVSPGVTGVIGITP